MSLASDELDESQITAMDLPMDFKVNWISPFGVCARLGPVDKIISNFPSVELICYFRLSSVISVAQEEGQENKAPGEFSLRANLDAEWNLIKFHGSRA